jgi:hypothetical protein
MLVRRALGRYQALRAIQIPTTNAQIVVNPASMGARISAILPFSRKKRGTPPIAKVRIPRRSAIHPSPLG